MRTCDKRTAVIAMATGLLLVTTHLTTHLAMADRAQEQPRQDAMTVTNRTLLSRSDHGTAIIRAQVPCVDQIVVFGGQSDDGALLGDTLIGDARFGFPYLRDRILFRVVRPSGPSPRKDVGMAGDQDGNVFLFGGDDGSGSAKGDTWLWRRNNWTQIGNDPSLARKNHGMVYDRATGGLFVFGGEGAGGRLLGDTLQGTITDERGRTRVHWRRVSTSGPDARKAFGMTATDCDEIHLFGGRGRDGMGRGDTWVFDTGHIRWTHVSSSGPPAVWDNTFTYDPCTGRSLMFGGQTDASDFPRDTWAFERDNRPPYNRRIWTRVTDRGPRARAGASALFFDELLGIPLIGGTGDDGRSIGDAFIPVYFDDEQVWDDGNDDPEDDDGACCFDDGSCEFLFEADCLNTAGDYQGDGVTCGEAGCPQPGACCFDDGSCTFVLESACDADGGIFQGEDVSCDDANCPQPGACCFDDGSCEFGLEVECDEVGGVFQGEDVSCDDANCPQPGACCIGDGSCKFGLEVECDGIGGVFQGEDVDCADANCDVGACCFDDGSCEFMLENGCDSGGGMYQGDGVLCDDVDCPVSGACCFDDGTCEFLAEVDCDDVGGAHQGDGVVCDDVDCPVSGACCFDDGTCEFVAEVDCDDAGGAHQGDGVVCDDVDCPVSGACCFDDGTCEFLSEDDCVDAGGAHQGDGIMCDDVDCPVSGACCFDDGTCEFLSEVDCDDAGGAHQGDGVTCAEANCSAGR